MEKLKFYEFIEIPNKIQRELNKNDINSLSTFVFFALFLVQMTKILL